MKATDSGVYVMASREGGSAGLWPVSVMYSVAASRGESMLLDDVPARLLTHSDLEAMPGLMAFSQCSRNTIVFGDSSTTLPRLGLYL